MKFINIKWVFLFVVVYAIAIAVTVPVQYLLPYAQSALNQAGVSVQSANGNLWQGYGRVTHQQLGLLDVTWKSHPSSLLVLRLPVSVTLESAHLALSAQLTPSVSGFSMDSLTGFIDDQAARPWLQPNRVEITGRLQLNDIAAASSWGLELKQASGDASWSGGAITLPVGRQLQSYQVPMMLGELVSNEQAWVFSVNSGSGERYIDATLGRDGMASLSVKRSLAEAMSLPIPAGGRSLFDMSQQVF